MLVVYMRRGTRGRGRGGVGGTNLDAGGFVQLVRFHVYDLARLAIDTPRMLSIRMFCLKGEIRKKN